MIKFCSQDEVSSYLGCTVCHDIEVGNRVVIKKGEIINDKIVKISQLLQSYKLMIVCDDKVTKQEIKDFILGNFNDIYMVEFDYLNKRYNYIFNKEFRETMGEFIKISLMGIDASYLLQLLTTPVVLRKSVDLTIMSFYFSLKMNLTPREIEDVFISSLLCNVNLCKSGTMMNLEDVSFLTDFKKLYNNSYEIIKDDKGISTNVKRIIRYLNDHNYNKTVYVTEEQEEVLKDPTLEIIQLTNDLLTYNFENSTISLYSTKYTQIRPAITDFFKNMKNMKHRIKIQKIRKKLRLW